MRFLNLNRRYDKKYSIFIIVIGLLGHFFINRYVQITGDVASLPPPPREEVAGRLDDLELALGEDGVKGRRIEDRTELQNEQETVKVITFLPEVRISVVYRF
jgi:hypothetical protein